MDKAKWMNKDETWFKANLNRSDKEVAAWQRFGFSFKDAVVWAGWGVTSSRAKRYLEDGVRTVPDWRNNFSGMTLANVLAWQAEGVSFEEAQQWFVFGVKRENALLLRSKGFKPIDVHDFNNEGISSTRAVKWLSGGFYVEQAVQWIAWRVSYEKATEFLKNGISEPPSVEFQEAGINLIDALKWTQAGIDVESALDWCYWDVPTDLAIELELMHEMPPGEDFKDVELSYDMALKWLSEFSEDEIEISDNGVKTYWKIWFKAGFSVQSAKIFQNELANFIKGKLSEDFLARKRPPYLNTYKNDDKEVHYKYLLEECLETISHLSATGMKITIENVVLWRGLTSEQILACIDGGIDPETGYFLGDSVLSEDAIELHALLRENGFYSSPTTFKLLGLSNPDLKKLIKLKINLDDFLTVSRYLNISGSELVKWVNQFRDFAIKIEWNVDGRYRPFIEEWIVAKFSPKEAWGWYSQNFTVKTAKAWVDSGVTDPAIAIRRKNAGLEPK